MVAMTPIIVTTKILTKIEELLASRGIPKQIDSILDCGEKLGVEDVRRWIKNLKWIEAKDKNTVYWLKDVDLLSVECQMVLLKTLEELSGSMVLVLSVGSLEKVIDTVISRCEVVKIKGEERMASDDRWNFFIEMIKADWAMVMQGVEKINEMELEVWAESMVIKMRERLRNEKNEKRIKVCERAITLFGDVRTNANKRLVMDRFFIDAKMIAKA